MSVAIATKGYFIPAVGTGSIIQTGGGTGFGPAIPKFPIIFVIDVDDKELEYPFIQLIDISNGER